MQYQLEKGVYLEDKNTLLPWGGLLNKLASKNNATVLKLADRLLINWGTHRILNGLELDLTTTYLGKPHFLLRKHFTIISSWAIGDKEAKAFFNNVSDHLILTFGELEKEFEQRTVKESHWTWHTETRTLYCIYSNNTVLNATFQ